MKRICVLASILIVLTLLSSCLNNQPVESESVDTSSDITSLETENNISGETESLISTEGSETENNISDEAESLISTEVSETEESDSEYVSNTEDSKEETVFEDTSETETETEFSDSTQDECDGEIVEIFSALLEASYENKIELKGNRFYDDSMTSWRYVYDIVIEDGNLFLSNDKQYHIMEYTEDIVLIISEPDFSHKNYAYAVELTSELNKQGCYIIKCFEEGAQYNAELAVYYLDGYFYVVKCVPGYAGYIRAIHVFEVPLLSKD